MTANKFFAARYKELARHYRVKHTTLAEHMEQYGNLAMVLSWKLRPGVKLGSITFPWLFRSLHQPVRGAAGPPCGLVT